MATAVLTAEEQTRNHYNVILAFLRKEGLLLADEHLAFRVDEKIEAGEDLTDIEATVLMLGLTEAAAQFLEEQLV